MEKNTSSINLVRGSNVGIMDKFIKWALNIGRLIIIATEVIALSAFLYRFSLDAQLIDLHTKITQGEKTVTFYKPIETTYRDLQDRIALAKQLSGDNTRKDQTIHDVLTLAANGLVINNFSLTDNTLTIDANVRSITSLNTFINQLKKYRNIAGVSIDAIENKSNTASIAVSITALLQK